MIKQYEKAADEFEAEQDEYLKEALMIHPPIAQA
jgi:hypothetical protein